MIGSCVCNAVRSQNSTRMRMSRATMYVPPTAHAGSSSLALHPHELVHQRDSSPGVGFAVPSLNPSRLRCDTRPAPQRVRL